MTRRLRDELNALLGAIGFLTRLPVPISMTARAADLSASAAYFPVVGLLVGGLAALVFRGARACWSLPVAALLSTGAAIIATGAMHEDALADAADGFGGGTTPERIRAIMKDSRVGSYALVTLIIVIGAKVAALTEIAAQGGPVAGVLIVAHVLGRWSSVPLMRGLPYAGVADPAQRASAGGAFVRGASTLALCIATVIAAATVALLLPHQALLAGLSTMLITLLAGAYAKQRIGGVTGDVLGATNQLVELGVYLVAAARRLG